MPPFVTAHIVFMFLGIITLIPAVVLQFVSRGNPNSYKIHRILAIIGLLFITAGITSIVTFFVSVKAPHLQSLHGKIGALGFLMLVDAAIVGLFFAKYPVPKKIHKFLGGTALLIVLTAATLGIIEVIQSLSK